MSRSYKKPISKTKGPQKDTYNKVVRKHFKRAVDKALEDPDEGFEPPSVRDKIQDYNYTEFVSKCINTQDCYCLLNYGRKKCENK